MYKGIILDESVQDVQRYVWLESKAVSVVSHNIVRNIFFLSIVQHHIETKMF